MSRTLFVRSRSCRVFFLVVLAAGVFLVMSTSHTQAQRRHPPPQPASEDPLPAFHEYRGVQLGMAADDVRKKLGEPKDKGDEQDFYLFTETEMAQFIYDKTRKVTAISVDFMSPNTSVPSAKQVLGSELDVKADGSMYRLIRYPKAGYWLSYNRTSGTSPLTTVTLQKIE